MTEQGNEGNSPLSILAPAAFGLLPAMLLACVDRARDESFDWSQHLLAGLVFATVFAGTFLPGWPRRGVAAMGAGGAAIIVALIIVWGGLPGFQGIFVLAGALVGAGYWLSQRGQPAILSRATLVAIGSTLGLWALSRLSWWAPFEETLARGGNRGWFLAATAAVVGYMYVWERTSAPTPSRRTAWLLDGAVLVVLAAAVARTTDLAGNLVALHHWSVYIAPAEMVREGRALLGQVPSQYGFLNILLLAGFPTGSCMEALYWMQVITLWASGVTIYFVLRAWSPVWWWQLGAGAITTLGVAFFCGDLSRLTGPMGYPNVGAFRFIWVHLLLGYLFWWQLRAEPGAVPRSVLRVGSALWLAGMLWSVESGLYVTAAWLPAASLLAMGAGDGKLSGLDRLRALGGGIATCLRLVALYLAGAVVLILIAYIGIYHRAPEWAAYLEYARAFTGDRSLTFPIDPTGPAWALLLLHAGLLAALVSVRRRRDLAMIWAAWGAFWAVSTYYIGRSHANNISNIGPVLLLVIGILVHVAKTAEPRGILRPWAWIVTATWMGAMVWLVVTNPGAFKRQFAEYQATSRLSRLLPADAGAGQLLAQCLRAQPDPFSLIATNGFDWVAFELGIAHPNWLPLRSLPLLGALPVARREHYLDVYHPRAVAGWLLAPLDMEDGQGWLFDYIDARFAVSAYLRNDRWQAWHYVPRDERAETSSVLRGLYHPDRGIAYSLQFARKFGGNIDPRLLTFSAQHPDADGNQGLLGATSGAAEMRVNFPVNRVQVEMVLRRKSADFRGTLAANFAAYASPADHPEVRYQRWKGRVELPVGQDEISVTQEIDGSGLCALFTVDLPPEFAGRVVAGWRAPQVNHVTQDSAAPAWSLDSREPAIAMDETMLARLLPDHWRPVEAWMRRGYLGPKGIELSAGGEIWLKARNSFTKLSGESAAVVPANNSQMTAVRGFWYKGGRMHWYDPPWSATPPAGSRPFFAVAAEAGGWLVITTDPNPARFPAVVRVTDVSEAK